MARPPGIKETRPRLTRGRVAVALAVERAEKAGVMPLDVILSVMRGEAGSEVYTQRQVDMAIAAAPYLHARLASTDMTMKSDNVHRVVSEKPITEDEWVAQHAANDADPAKAPDRAAG